jgi:hypothetical protein
LVGYFGSRVGKIAKFYEKAGARLVLRRMVGKYFNHCAHVLNKSFKGFTGGKDIRKENFPKSEKSGGASLNKVARQLYGTAALPSELFCSSHLSFLVFGHFWQ